jgi:hypothetical protein
MTREPQSETVEVQLAKLASTARQLRIGLLFAIMGSLVAVGVALTARSAAIRSGKKALDFPNGLTLRDAKGQAGIFLGYDPLGRPTLSLHQANSSILVVADSHGGSLLQLVDARGGAVRIELEPTGDILDQSIPTLRLFHDSLAKPSIRLSVLPDSWPLLELGRTDQPHVELNLWSKRSMEARLRFHEPARPDQIVRAESGSPPPASPHLYFLGYNGEVLRSIPDPTPERELADSRQRRRELDRRPQPYGGVW